MSKKAKIQLFVSILFGCLFLGIAAYQWFDLYQIEQGLKEGTLSIVLHKIYQVAGKWGVAAIYLPFALYCFWRAYAIRKAYKAQNEYSNYEESEHKDNDNIA